MASRMTSGYVWFILERLGGGLRKWPLSWSRARVMFVIEVFVLLTSCSVLAPNTVSARVVFALGD